MTQSIAFRPLLGCLFASLSVVVLARPIPAASLGDSLKPGVDTEYPSLERLYQDFHAHPELSFHEEKTAAKLASELKALGLEVTTAVGGHGVVGVLRNGAGATLLVRTDLDALPVKEQTGLPYSSR